MTGPKSTVDKEKIEKLLKDGHLKKDIATMLGLSYATIKKYTKGSATQPQPTSKYICKTCGKTGQTHFYESVKYYCKNCFNEQSYCKQKDKMLQYMESRGGAKCQRCGYDKYIGALEFHHRDPSQKDPNWKWGWTNKRLHKELDKCDILCSNCHREVHAEMRKQGEKDYSSYSNSCSNNSSFL